MASVLILGSQGMIGHVVAEYFFKCGHSVVTAARCNADYNIDFEAISEIRNLSYELKKFDFVINCVGLLINDSIKNPERALKVNSILPHFLASAISGEKTRFIQTSTDCVFDGQTGYYAEVDRPTEVSVYGYTKALGEVVNSKDITFRASIIGPEIGKNRSGLLDWFLNEKADPLKGWINHFWSGLTTLEYSKILENYVRNPNISGIHHLVEKDFRISKHALLSMLNETYFQGNKKIEAHKNTKFQDKSLVANKKSPIKNVAPFSQQLSELGYFIESSKIYNYPKLMRIL